MLSCMMYYAHINNVVVFDCVCCHPLSHYSPTLECVGPGGPGDMCSDQRKVYM